MQDNRKNARVVFVVSNLFAPLACANKGTYAVRLS
jgi:hypothetical protein